MPSRKVEEQIGAIASLRSGANESESVPLLRKALADPAGLVVSKAAAAVAAGKLKALTQDLLKAYARLFEQGVKRDTQCWGKIAVAKALVQLDYGESEPFLQGLAYRQWEPVWGGEADTAAPLRAVCCLAILQCTDLLREDKLWQLARALTDREAIVRLDAVRALEQLEGREAVLLLRLKARMGDEDAGLTGQVLQSILSLEGGEAISFVGEFLHQRGWAQRNEELAEHAAIALGSSRLSGALELLIESWRDRAASRVDQEAILRAISSSRQEKALDFLLQVLGEGRQIEAIAAAEALGIHQESESIRARVQAVVEERDNAEVSRTFQKAFG